MKETILRRSKAAGLEQSILPEFSENMSQLLKGSIDYLGVNMYTSNIAKAINYTTKSLFWQDCIEAESYLLSTWKKTSADWLRVSIVEQKNIYMILKQ